MFEVVVVVPISNWSRSIYSLIKIGVVLSQMFHLHGFTVLPVAIPIGLNDCDSLSMVSGKHITKLSERFSSEGGKIGLIDHLLYFPLILYHMFETLPTSRIQQTILSNILCASYWIILFNKVYQGLICSLPTLQFNLDVVGCLCQMFVRGLGGH
jgi:hypothetical protein